MTTEPLPERPRFGAEDLKLPDELRAPLHAHLAVLRRRYLDRGWGTRVGFGARPALLVIDLALFWTDPRNTQMGSPVDSVVRATCRLLAAARASGVPIVFTTYAYDPTDPPAPHDSKLRLRLGPRGEALFALDPRLARRPTEPLVRKKYASAFKATNLHEMLTGLGGDPPRERSPADGHPGRPRCRLRRRRPPAPPGWRRRRRGRRDHPRRPPLRRPRRPHRRGAHRRPHPRLRLDARPHPRVAPRSLV